jgi:hypothetical protein
MGKKKSAIAITFVLFGYIIAVASGAFGSTEGNTSGADGLKNAVTLSINGTKFDDANMNAVFDDGEQGLSGWVIRLNLDGKEISNTVTNESGFYSFINLEPGNYTVTEDRQASWGQSLPGSGCHIINLSDKSAYSVNFGNFRIPNASSVPVSHSSVVVRPFKSSDDNDDYGPPRLRIGFGPLPTPHP